MTNAHRKSTDNIIHRIAELKKQYGAKNADSYVKASERIKKEIK